MIDLVPRSPFAIGSEWQRDRARGVGWLASDDGQVPLADTSHLEGRAKGSASFTAPREDEKARCVAIEAMHSFERTECLPESNGDGWRVERRAGWDARHSGRFVDDHDPIVGEHDVRRPRHLVVAVARAVAAHRSPSIDTQRQSRSAGGASESKSSRMPTG